MLNAPPRIHRLPRTLAYPGLNLGKWSNIRARPRLTTQDLSCQAWPFFAWALAQVSGALVHPPKVSPQDWKLLRSAYNHKLPHQRCSSY